MSVIQGFAPQGQFLRAQPNSVKSDSLLEHAKTIPQMMIIGSLNAQFVPNYYALFINWLYEPVNSKRARVHLFGAPALCCALYRGKKNGLRKEDRITRLKRLEGSHELIQPSFVKQTTLGSAIDYDSWHLKRFPVETQSGYREKLFAGFRFARRLPALDPGRVRRRTPRTD